MEARKNILFEGIQSVDLCKICSNAGDKKSSGVDLENKLAAVCKNKYRIHLDHQIVTDDGVLYPQALYNDLAFEVTLAPAEQVVRGSDPAKLAYELKNIQLQYKTIRSEKLTEGATSMYTNGKGFAYDHVMREEVFTFAKGTEARLNLRVNPQSKSLRAILLLFIEPFVAGVRHSEKYFNPDITKVRVTINGSPNRIYNEGIEASDMWEEISRFFETKNKVGRPNMDFFKYIAENKFGLFIDLRSMANINLHGSGTSLEKTKNGIHLAIERVASGSGNVYCHVYTISDAQMNIKYQQLENVQV